MIKRGTLGLNTLARYMSRKMAGTAITTSTTRIMIGVEHAAHKAGHGTPQCAEACRHDGNGKGDLERALATDHEPSEYVEPVGVCAERAPRSGRQVREGDVGLDLVAVVHERAEEAERCHNDNDPESDHTQTVLQERQGERRPGPVGAGELRLGEDPDLGSVEFDGHGQVSHISPSGPRRHRRDPPAGCRGRWRHRRSR